MTLIRIGMMVLCLFSNSVMAEQKIELMALFQDKAMLNIDGKNYMMKAGKTKKGITLISASQTEAWIEMAGEKIELTFKKGIATSFTESKAQKPKKNKRRKGVVRLTAAADGHHYITAKINGKSIPMLVDTGASIVAIYKKMAKKIGLKYKKVGKKSSVMTANGKARAYRVIFEKVQVESITLRNVAGVVIENDSDVALLGMSFLSRLDLTNSRGVMTLTKR